MVTATKSKLSTAAVIAIVAVFLPVAWAAVSAAVLDRTKMAADIATVRAKVEAATQMAEANRHLLSEVRDELSKMNYSLGRIEEHWNSGEAQE